MSQRERVNQKRRTRSALVESARELLAEGRTPTVAAAAERALVSRATAYRYFPSQEHLLLETVLERTFAEVERAVAASSAADGAGARVAALVSAVHDEVASNEAGFRSLLRHSVAQIPSDEATVAAIRGDRRLRWIEQALEPVAADLDERDRRRLVHALALCVGAEAFVVLHDLCGLDRDEAADTLRWTASALVAAVTG